jgi:site-specific DNA recombinase
MPRADSSRKRCAIYTRKSSEEGLEQEFNSLEAQREACEAYIRSQRHEGWRSARNRYDDGGFSGGNLERPALQRLLADISAGRIDIIVVYKVDRLTRSLADFARLVEIFDIQSVSFVSVTQQFNTTSSMGRLTLPLRLRPLLPHSHPVSLPLRSSNWVSRFSLVRPHPCRCPLGHFQGGGRGTRRV